MSAAPEHPCRACGVVGADGALRPRWLFFVGFLMLAGQGRFLSVMLESLALSDAEIGVVSSLPRSLNAVTPLLWGLLADRVLGRQLAICASAGASAVAFGMLYFSQFQTFEGVLVLRTVHGVLLAGFAPLMDSYCLAHVLPAAADAETADTALQRKKLYGRERLWGAISWALGNLLLGYLFDVYDSYMLMVPFYVIMSVVVIVVILTNVVIQRRMASAVTYAKIDVEDAGPVRSTEVELTETTTPAVEVPPIAHFAATDEVDPAAVLPPANALADRDEESAVTEPQAEDDAAQKRAEASVPEKVREFGRVACCSMPNLIFFCTLAVASAGVSLVENLSFIFFKDDIGTSNFVMGISVCVTVSFEIPLFAVANSLISRFSPPTLLFWGLIAYSVRVFAYTLIPREYGALILVCEPLHGVTFALIQLSSVMIVSDMAPAGLESFAQSSIAAARSLGTSIGLVVGSLVMETYGAAVMYRGASVIVLAMAFVYYVIAVASSSSPLSRQVEPSS